MTLSGSGTSDAETFIIGRSRDPNQKLGPAGFGTQAFIPATSTIPYRIDFENDKDAEAPAQLVDVTDQLSNLLDWSTFELTEVGFGEHLVSVPVGTQNFQTVVSHTDNGQTFDVIIDVEFDPLTGFISTRFQSIDPTTSLPPDPRSGMLPPEDGTGRGQGHISYIIRPQANLSSGTAIRNIAIIQFDRFEIIATNQVDPHDPSKGTDPTKEALVTIDRGTPTSSITALPATTLTTAFTVNWSGSDDTGGSGIGTYDIFVSDNGGEFTPWLTGTTDTSAEFLGELGHTYAFYSVAHDNVGHTEPAPTTADTSTTTVMTSNEAPVAENGTLATRANVAVTGTLVATDLDDDSLTYQLVSTVDAHGQVSLGTNGAFTYTPNANYFGPASFTFLANDGSMDSNIATVSITVTGGVAVELPNTAGLAFRVIRDRDRLVVWRVKPTNTSLRVGSVPFFTQTAIKDIQVLRIEGGSQNDQVVIDPKLVGYFRGTLVLNGNDGNDTFDARALKTPIIINGGNGGDTLLGGRGNDSIDGGAGNDSLLGNEGQDVIYGGTGLDTIQGGVGGDTVFGGDDKDEIYGGDKSRSVGDGNDKIHGGAGDDIIKGGRGQDTLCGDADNDKLQGDAGNDLVVGGDGVDVLYGNDGNDILLGGRGNDILYGGAQNDQLLGQEDDDLIVGNDGKDRIDGGSGNDTLRGREGNDSIFGSSGNDKIAGGTGNDLLVGGGGSDYLHGGELPVSVYAIPRSESIRGSDGKDTLHGGTDADTVNGGNGRNAVFQDGLDTITDLFAFSIEQILSEC